MQLYLSEEWIDDAERRLTAGIPETIQFKRKWELAIDLLDRALGCGVRPRIALADAGYGDAVAFRDALRERGLQYIVGVTSTHWVRPPGAAPKGLSLNSPARAQAGEAETAFQTHPSRPSASPVAFFGRGHGHGYGCPNNSGTA
jgi:SRSO17 transposase